jgi:small-conductance mechanosensitive channel
LEQERDIVEARLNALRKAQLELQNRLAHLEQLNGHEPAVRERLEALEQQESRGREMLAIIARVESVAERLERQLVEETKVRDWTQVWEQAAGSVAEIWGRELFVMKDEIEVDGAVVTEERGFTVGRTVIGMAAFAGVFLMGWMIRAMLRRCVLPRLTGDAQHPRDLSRDIVVAIIRNTSTFFLLVIALWIASRTLPWRGVLHGVLGGALTVAIWCQIGLWGNAVLGRVLQRNRLRREEADPASLTAYGLLGFFGRVAIWASVALTILWALDYQIAPLIGALGVSGIAVAFALQSILADIFNSMAIILDKPFRVSDFIIVGDTLGTVEQIGIKTTRIRSLTGEQIIMTNSDLLGSRIRNFKRMLERRVAFKFGVVYQTAPEKLEQIPSMLKAIIQGVQRTRFDRAHFFEYGDFSLNFEVVYYVSGSDYTVYMDIQQAINLAMFRQFAAAGIEFAYPTQSIMVQRSAPAPRELQAAPVPYPG